jgi:chemotaxis protein MotB
VARRRRRAEHDEAHGNHERWLVSYADMMTLLMVLFIVMFAISQVDQRKFNQLREGMAAGFGQQPSPFQGDRSVLSEAGVAPMAPVAPGAVSPVRPTGPDTRPVSGPESDPAQLDAIRRARSEAEAEVARFEDLARVVRRALARQGLARDVALRIDGRGLRISMVSRHIVFRADRADLSPRGTRVLDVLAPVLADLPNQIEVAGHTNQVQVRPKYYPTDWDLSAARAVAALRYLNERGGVPAGHMVAAAYGHEQPLRDPDLPGSQAMNKRVDVVVLSTAQEDVQQLFASVAEDRSRT